MPYMVADYISCFSEMIFMKILNICIIFIHLHISSTIPELLLKNNMLILCYLYGNKMHS